MGTRPLWFVLAALLAVSKGEEASLVFTVAPSLSTLMEVLEEVPRAECRRQVAVLLEGIRNLTDWALQMADATAKVPSGLLRGNLRALGDMDECVAVEAEVQNTTLEGKFCLASFHMDSDSAHVARLLDVATGGRRHLELRHREIDAGNGVVVQSPGFVPELSRGEWGVCVPSACSAADVEAALRGLARRLLPSTGLNLDVRVPPLACRTRAGPARTLRAPHLAFAFIIAVFIVLSVIGTIWDSCNGDESADELSLNRVVLRAFSLRVGWKRLTSERKVELGGIAGIRALSSLFTVLAHELMYFPQEPSINKTKIIDGIQKIYYTPMITGIIVVDTFFTMSGTLYSFHLGNSVIDGSFSYIATLLYRFLRLSPVYFLQIWFYATFLEYLGDGPNWANFVNYNVEMCRAHWIWNVLYINNYANLLGLCVQPSWFVAADVQFVVVAPLAALPLFRWRRGRQLLVALVALSVGATAATIAFLRIPGTYRVFDTDRQITLYLLYAHTKTHMHASPYLVGLYLGYLLHRMQNKRISLSKRFLTLGWTTAALMFLANSVGPHYMLQESYTYSILDSAAYPAVGRLLWAIGVSWIIFTCHAGYGGLLNRLLNCYALRVLSRLSYLLNLTHFILLMHNGGRRRTPLWIDEFTWVQIFIADYVLAMAISFVIYLLIDSPINLIVKSLFMKGSSEKMNEKISNENKNK